MFKEEEGLTEKFLDRLLCPQHTMSIINGYVCHSIHQTPAPRQISSRPLLCLSSETELTTRNIQRITTIQSTSDRNTVRSFGINQHQTTLFHTSSLSTAFTRFSQTNWQNKLVYALHWEAILWKKPSGCIVSNCRLQKLEALLLKAVAIGKSFRQHSKSASIAGLTATSRRFLGELL